MPIGPGEMLAQRYQLRREIGQGGMGTVWEAEDHKLQRTVAVKVVKRELMTSPAMRARFEHEAKAAGRLSSAHIVEVHDYGTHEGSPFMVMELLKGTLLSTHLKLRGRLSIEDTADLVIMVAKALSVAHRSDVVHRDLKPNNIFIVDDDDCPIAKVFDFGLAKTLIDDGETDHTATQRGTVVGTPRYMSPEQARGEQPLDHMVDLWALAVIAFECLTGRPPFDASVQGTLLQQISKDAHPFASSLVPTLPKSVDAFFARGLAKDKTRRFTSARDIATALARLAGIPEPSNTGLLSLRGAEMPLVESLAPTRDHATGDLVSQKYRLGQLLSTGTAGTIWSARNESSNRDFAMKFLRPEIARDTPTLQRCFLDLQTYAQLRHPAIADIYDIGQSADGSPYLVMELLTGEGLDERLAKNGPMPIVDACRYFSYLARGLSVAHQHGLVHRDLRPGNIFFAVDSRGNSSPKLLDFALSAPQARRNDRFLRTGNGEVLGSPAYLSPEQAENPNNVDARSDLWALGVIMYETVSGKLPFDGRSLRQLTAAIMAAGPVPLASLVVGVPPALATLVHRLLSRLPEHRPESAEAVAIELETIYGTLTDLPLIVPERVHDLSLGDASNLEISVAAPVTQPNSNRAWWAVAATVAAMTVGLVAMPATPTFLDARLTNELNTTVARTITRFSHEFEVPTAIPHPIPTATTTAPASADKPTPSRRPPRVTTPGF